MNHEIFIDTKNFGSEIQILIRYGQKRTAVTIEKETLKNHAEMVLKNATRNLILNLHEKAVYEIIAAEFTKMVLKDELEIK